GARRDVALVRLRGELVSVVRADLDRVAGAAARHGLAGEEANADDLSRRARRDPRAHVAGRRLGDRDEAGLLLAGAIDRLRDEHAARAGRVVDALDDLRRGREREGGLRETLHVELRVLVMEGVVADDGRDVLLHHEVGARAAARRHRLSAAGGAIGEAPRVRPEQAEVDRALRAVAARRGARSGAARALLRLAARAGI